ncbi:MAG: hypothetical protein ACYTA5_14985 [Planctomycetota bacterium]
MKHINQLCLRMLNDPPALMRYLSNPPPYTSALEDDEEDDYENDDDDQTNPKSSNVDCPPSSSLRPTASGLLPPVHGPKTNPCNMEET